LIARLSIKPAGIIASMSGKGNCFDNAIWSKEQWNSAPASGD
jgi:hypothetical protein